MGSNSFIASVGSNGCTDKDYFKVDVKRQAGLSEKAPHYVLTIMRIKADECKEIVNGGTLVLFNLEKDLGIKGDFTYSITNRVFSSSKVPSTDESLWSIIEKYFTVKPALESAVDAAEAAEAGKTSRYTIEGGYFSCDLPEGWALSRNPEEDAEYGIYEIRLSGGKGQGGAEIVVSYCAPGNKDFSGYEDYVARNSKDAFGAVKTATSSYEPVKEIKLSGRPALELAREKFMYLHPHEKSTEGISLKEHIYVFPAKEFLHS